MDMERSTRDSVEGVQVDLFGDGESNAGTALVKCIFFQLTQGGRTANN